MESCHSVKSLGDGRSGRSGRSGRKANGKKVPT